MAYESCGFYQVNIVTVAGHEVWPVSGPYRAVTFWPSRVDV